MKRLRAVAAAGVCAVALGACGDDDSETTTAVTAATDTTATDSAATDTTAAAAGALSKKEYLQQADEICARANKEINAASGSEAPTLIQEALAELRALPAPEGDDGQLDEVYTAGEEGLSTLQGATEPPQGDPFEEFTKLADDYGFKGGCTENQG